ncbi:hypothetical protein ABW19_dt0202406 [Dactylella cylindrospora]|nr:hypothetical protein ABW19_dt0202406 [Dactylella cylindrospora]
MALDESYFSFDIPEEERGQGAWIRPTAGKRKLSDREGSKGDGRTKSDPSKRKIKRAASDRLISGSQSLWGDIMGQGKAPKLEKPNEWGSDDTARPTKKVEDVVQDAEPTVPYINVNASVSILDPHPPQPKKMFHDLGFHAYGFDAEKEEKVRAIIRNYDGNTYDSVQELYEASSSRYIIIVPDTYAQCDCPRISDASRAVQIVTSWWLERCLHEERFIEPDEYQLGRPMKRQKLKEFEDMTISVTRFDGVDYLHYTKAIQALGAKFCEQLAKSRSLLIVNTSDHREQQDKTKAAETWKIPIVSQDWLLECILDGEFIPFKKYLLNESSLEDDIKKEPGCEALEGCNIKFDSAIKVKDKHMIKRPEGLVTTIVTPRKPKNPQAEGTAERIIQASHTETPKKDSENPFIIEEIEAQREVEDAVDRFLPLSISPPANERRNLLAQKSQSNSLANTPSKLRPLISPAKKSPFKLATAPRPPGLDKPPGAGLLRNNLTEILRLAKQQENKPAALPKRPPRKFQGRALSNENSLRDNGNNSLSRSNSLQSNRSLGLLPGAGESGESNSNNPLSLSRANSISNGMSNTLEFGESMLYDSNNESGPQEFDTQPSQAIHYIDADAEAEKKKLFEKLALTDDGGVMKGRKVVESTVAAEELGGPMVRRTTRKIGA